MEKHKRKHHRLTGFNYSSAASYLLTFNVCNNKYTLSEILFTDMYSPPIVKLLPFGKITDKYISQIENNYPGVILENYVIMPDHIHLLITIEPHSTTDKKFNQRFQE